MCGQNSQTAKWILITGRINCYPQCSYEVTSFQLEQLIKLGNIAMRQAEEPGMRTPCFALEITKWSLDVCSEVLKMLFLPSELQQETDTYRQQTLYQGEGEGKDKVVPEYAMKAYGKKWFHHPRRISTSLVANLCTSLSCATCLQLTVSTFLLSFSTSHFHLDSFKVGFGVR